MEIEERLENFFIWVYFKFVVIDKIGEGGLSSIIRDRDTMREGEGERDYLDF